MGRENPQKFIDVDDLQQDLGRQSVRGGAWSTVGQLVKSILELASFPILARLLTPDDFGLVGMAVAVTGFLAMFKDMGLTMATVQRKELTHAQVSALFWINAGLGFLVTIVAGLSAWALAWFYDQPELVGITLALAVAFSFNGLTVQHEALLKRRMLFGRLIIVEAAALSAAIGTAIILALMGWGYWALVAQSVVLALVTLIGVWLAMGWRPSMPAKAEGMQSLLFFGFNLTGYSFVNYFARNLDDVLIGRFSGAAALGFYQQAYKIFKVPLTQINAPVSKVAIPALSRLVGQPERYREAYRGVLEKLLVVTMPLGVLLIGAADWAILTILGEQWAPATPIFIALSVSIFTQAIGNTTGWLFISQDRTDEMLKWGLIGAAMSIASFIVGLPWGAFGVALAYSVSGLVLRAPFLFWYIGRRGPIRTSDFYTCALPALIPTVGAAAALWAFREFAALQMPLLNLLLSIVIVAATTLAIAFLMPNSRRVLRETISLLRYLRRSSNEADGNLEGTA